MKNSNAGVERILVVEDELAITWVCRRVLNNEGFEVDIAVNGVVAQDMLVEKEYKLIIVDIRTPLMNGKEFYQYLNDRYPGLTNRVIFTTGDTLGSDTQSFLGLAGRPFLPKPFTPDDLRGIVKETLGRLS